MKKSTILLIAALAVAGSASAQLRWNPENAWATNNGADVLPVGADNKTVINKLGKLDNGNYRADIRYAQTAHFIEDEPYLVCQITTDGCSWNLNDFKFEFMLQRKLSDGLNEEGAVKWGGNTESTHEAYPSFFGDKLKVVDQYEADLYQLLGSSVVNGDGDKVYTEDVIVLDLNKVKATDEDRTPGLLFSAGAVDFPNYNSFVDIVPADENGEGGVQQRSWFGFVCIAPGASVTKEDPSFIIHYTGTVADSSDALMVCEDYANGEGGQEVRDDDDDPDGIKAVRNENVNVFLKNGKTVVAEGAAIYAYTADGKLVMSGNNTMELPNGLYIVKAVKNGVAKTVKAIVR